MNAKAYYLTTLGDWQRHTARFANSHWLALDQNTVAAPNIESAHAHDSLGHEPVLVAAPGISAATRIIVLVEADEGAHLALDDDPAFEALPHTLAQRPISASVQAALAPLGVAPRATAFDAAEAAGRAHPLLRYRVF